MQGIARGWASPSRLTVVQLVPGSIPGVENFLAFPLDAPCVLCASSPMAAVLGLVALPGAGGEEEGRRCRGSQGDGRLRHELSCGNGRAADCWGGRAADCWDGRAAKSVVTVSVHLRVILEFSVYQ